MSRDYAYRPAAPRRQPPRKPAGEPLPGWLWGLGGLSIGLAVAAFVYIARPPAPMPGATPRPAVAEAPTDRPPPPTPQAYTFYELLPNQEVVVPPRPTGAAAPPPASAEAQAEYLVQVASYRQPADAERQKAALALIGLEARVESVTIDGRETFYRVRIGPVKGLDEGQRLVARLKENGLDGLLVRVR